MKQFTLAVAGDGAIIITITRASVRSIIITHGKPRSIVITRVICERAQPSVSARAIAM
jgi:hypothetical protein